jgi:hypothetical protein
MTHCNPTPLALSVQARRRLTVSELTRRFSWNENLKCFSHKGATASMPAPRITLVRSHIREHQKNFWRRHTQHAQLRSSTELKPCYLFSRRTALSLPRSHHSRLSSSMASSTGMAVKKPSFSVARFIFNNLFKASSTYTKKEINRLTTPPTQQPARPQNRSCTR